MEEDDRPGRTVSLKSKPQFIVFEGLDGSGTSTQAGLLHSNLIESGYPAVLTSEPTQGPVGAIIRLLMSHRLSFSKSSAAEDRFLAYLFAADRYDHLYNEASGIMRLLDRGTTVISTRYYLSSYAYHVHRDDDFQLVKHLNSDFPPPDVFFFLDTPVEECLRRMTRSRGVLEKYETGEKLTVVREKYLDAIQKLPDPVCRLDGSLTPEAISHQVVERVRTE